MGSDEGSKGAQLIDDMVSTCPDRLHYVAYDKRISLEALAWLSGM
jgi:hypothetical protein